MVPSSIWRRSAGWGTLRSTKTFTLAPPVFPWDGNFIHLDAGWQISPTQAPIRLPSEIGTTRKPPSGWDPKAHREPFLLLVSPQRSESNLGTETIQYYGALRNAIGQPTDVPPPEHDVIPAGFQIPTDHHRHSG